MTASPRLHRCLWLLLFLLAGCAGVSPEARLYLLSPMAEAKLAGPAMAWPREIPIVVGPVRLPDYLDRPQLVSRTSANQVQRSEFHRWGGSLPEEVTRVLAENLSRLLPGASVTPMAWQGSTQGVRLEVVFSRLDGVLGETMELEAQWSLVSLKEHKLLLTRTTRLREPTNGPDYTALVEAQSRLLGRLSMEMAEALGQVHP